MYLYDHIDQRLVDERVAQFRDQVRRHLAGELDEARFLPLRLQNGLYMQKHAHMLRIAIPYGLLSSAQLRRLAHIARTYDRDYAHFTTRQNVQLNWPALEDVPEILAQLAEVQMHAIQTSGNCIRNITTDQFAGVAPDEVADPFIWAELMRQWSSFHPEFAFLPRKFKIAISGSPADRAATLLHDIGVYALRGDDGSAGFRVVVGGGLGRTPMVGHVIREFLPWQHLLTYLEAVLRVYNRYGRRDNKYKARIKILVKDRTPAGFRDEVEAEWAQLAGGPSTVPVEEIDRISARFTRPAYRSLEADERPLAALAPDEPGFARWAQRNVHPHRVPGYAAVTLSLKPTGKPPGDASADQMDAIAALADRYSFGELRVSHEQNLVFSDVERSALPQLWRELRALGLATPNVGLLTNIVSCPGGDFCSLANAVSIPVAQAIQERFDDLDYLHDIGELDLNISGCINACGHHHIGHIGILGVDKAGEEWYQVTIGGRQGPQAAIGRIIGPSFARDEIPDVVERLIGHYLEVRESDAERFVDTVARIGLEPFKEAVYAHAD
ncbi:nitrite/sulfite reductase [Quisquiliibacterium transsilvanicum]|jgi:sulfite reductase (NADPH) hemoprotein beta-component|uniref:Sulfite reductase (NADPH) hemoprotein beta-component n=1 Tax=Quisquiliibacterium transsilvanicum TaxID=1549638 RepID=A0A7W8M794_9BURK|nr:nitrite/sulfite reductase [Quisquiliibacterium transsilvanicum]MBB5270701.1 sulfite reductase (NADPH) hemoprotein beta-component [Quisquiliibacterium transsilvanicum]